MNDIVTTVLGNDGKAPDAILWMPEGEHYIQATVNGQPGVRRVVVTRDCLARLQEDLSAKLAKNVKPVIYYDHKKGPVAYRPSAFDYVDGKGVVLHGGWTKGGKESVEGGDWGYHSPRFKLNAATGEVMGLVDDDIEVGSLVNEPAFEEIERIAASMNNDNLALFGNVEIVHPSSEDGDLKAEDAQREEQRKQPDNDMINKLVEQGILTSDEAKQDDAQNIALSRISDIKTKNATLSEEVAAAKADALKHEQENKSLEGKVNALEKEKSDLAESVSAAKAQQEGLVKVMIEEAVSAGKIAPQSDAIKVLETTYGNNPEGLAKVLGAMAPRKEFEDIIAGKQKIKEQENKDNEAFGLERTVAAFESDQ